jgi:hypothetical protein
MNKEVARTVLYPDGTEKKIYRNEREPFSQKDIRYQVIRSSGLRLWLAKLLLRWSRRLEANLEVQERLTDYKGFASFYHGDMRRRILSRSRDSQKLVADYLRSHDIGEIEQDAMRLFVRETKYAKEADFWQLNQEERDHWIDRIVNLYIEVS